MRQISIFVLLMVICLILSSHCVQYERSETDLSEAPYVLALVAEEVEDSSTTTTTTAPTEIYIYTEAILVTGGLGSRAASSSSCATVQSVNYAGLSCTNHLAVVSYTGDALADAATNHGVPTGLPIVSASGTTVVSTWPLFLSGPLTSTLDAAGVATTTPTPFYWSSSTTGGNYSGTWNCSDNTDGTIGSNGSQGAITTTANTHIAFAVNQPCDGSTNSAYLMCLCW